MNEEIKMMEQKIIHLNQLEDYRDAGWRYVGALADKRLVVERPLDESNPSKDLNESDARKYFKTA